MAQSVLGKGILAGTQCAFGIAVLMMGSITACNNSPIASTEPGSRENSSQAPASLTLVSYAVTRDAFEKIIPKFTEEWKTKTGQDVTFEQSYGGSGSQTRAVVDGLEADVVALALSSDVQKIEGEGLIQPGWEQEAPNGSIVTNSVIAFVTRESDNIKIEKWADLAKPEVKVITANPKTSGGARWNFLGIWGSVTKTGGTEEQAFDFAGKVLANAPVLPKDARESTDVFYKQGQGNVLLNYENEVLLAKQKGEEQPYIIPQDFNVNISGPVAVVDTNVDKKGTREVADAFVQYLFTSEAQQIFAETGFRPVNEEVLAKFSAQFPKLENLATIEDFGGWKKVQTEFFGDNGIFDQVITKVGRQ